MRSQTRLILRSPVLVALIWWNFCAFLWPVSAQPQRTDQRQQTLARFSHAIDENDTNTVWNMLEGDTNLVQSAYHTALPLQVAASRGRVEIVDWLLRKGAHINAAGDTLETSNLQITALEAAIWYGHPVVCKKLLDAGANPNHVSPFHGTALHFAFNFHREEMAGWLLDNGANPFLADRAYHPTTAFELAILQGSGRLVPRMLNPGLGPSVPPKRGAEQLKDVSAPGLGVSTARFLATNGPAMLVRAAEHGEPEAVEALFKAGVSLREKSLQRRSLLRAVALAAAMAVKGRDFAPDRWLQVRSLLLKHGVAYDVFAATGFGDIETARRLWSENRNLAQTADEDGQTPLHWAVRADRLPLTVFWLEAGASPAATNKAGQTALHLAAASGLTPHLNRLLAAQAPTNARDTNGWTPLDAAIRANQSETIRLLLTEKTAVIGPERGITTPHHEAAASGNIAVLASLTTTTNLDPRNELGLTPLHLAVRNGHLGAAALLVDKGADVNARDPDGNATLHLIMLRSPLVIIDRPAAGWLARMKQDPRKEPFLRSLTGEGAVRASPLLQAASFLLACGADAAATNKAGKSVVQYALSDSSLLFEEDRPKLLQLLARRGAGLNETDASGDTALHRAARELHGREAAELIAGGASLEATNHQGRTPLQASVERLEGWGAQPVEEILKAKPNVNFKDPEGLTALHILALSESPFRKEAAQALLKAGANPNLRDKQGRTPLHLLLMGKWPWLGAAECISLLAQAGADLSARDNRSQTPLHYLARMDGLGQRFFILGISNAFAFAGVDFQSRDNQGDTPLHIAARSGNSEVFNYLLATGASLDSTNTAGETPRLFATRQSNRFAHFERRSEIDAVQAARAGDLENIRALLKADGGLLDGTNQLGETPLRAAVLAHRTNVVEFLETNGARWDAVSAVMAARTNVLREILSRTPFAVTNTFDDASLLHLAAANGDVVVTRILLGAGSDITAQDRRGASPLGNALLQHHTAVAAVLRQHGAAENPFDAVYADHLETIARLYSSDAAITRSTNRAGLSVAEAATGCGRVNILKLLLDKGVKPECASERDGRTLLHYAAIYNHTNTAEMLVRHGAKIETPDRFGFSPLHIAAVAGSAEMVTWLLHHKANLQKLTGSPSTTSDAVSRRFSLLAGNSALHLAAMHGQTNVIELLLNAGAKINSTNAAGRTPLDLTGGTSFRLSSPMRFSTLDPRADRLNSMPTPSPSAPNLMTMRLAAARLLKKRGGVHSKSYSTQPGGALTFGPVR